MSEENLTPTRLLVELGDVHHSRESGNDGEKNLLSRLLDRRMTSSEIDSRINAIVAPLYIQLEALIQSVLELNERSSTTRLKETWHPNDKNGQVNVSTGRVKFSTSHFYGWGQGNTKNPQKVPILSFEKSKTFTLAAFPWNDRTSINWPPTCWIFPQKFT